MENYITIISLVFLFWSIAGIVARSVIINQHKQQLKDHLDTIIRVVSVIQDRDQLLAYDDENGQFLGQGASKEEMISNIMKNHPTKIFILDKQPFSANPIPGVTS
jgi:hypothetical protein